MGARVSLRAEGVWSQEPILHRGLAWEGGARTGHSTPCYLHHPPAPRPPTSPAPGQGLSWPGAPTGTSGRPCPLTSSFAEGHTRSLVRGSGQPPLPWFPPPAQCHTSWQNIQQLIVGSRDESLWAQEVSFPCHREPPRRKAPGLYSRSATERDSVHCTWLHAWQTAPPKDSSPRQAGVLC